ncbi:IS630 family transposase [Xanthomonas theicola]|uniref:IS630 family transposase n=1 Tax=Xanthomonas theicola TaxID=56464 RepID=UPI001304F3EA|nr:IS630 family transposase [Xanthomonas theicola]QNH26410.1 IS630 family transposase [Xanthomonas theicola]
MRALIRPRCGLTLTWQGVGLYPARWGFTPQKPMRRACEQRPEAVQAWRNETSPEMARRAKTEGAQIQWGEETRLGSDHVRGRSYAPTGKTPERRVASRREGLSVTSMATNRGQVRWKVFEDAMNADIPLDFLKRPIEDMRSKKVFLILDNLKVHHAKPVEAWLAEHFQEIDVFYLPSYSPEPNPDEMLNADPKANATKQVPARTKGQFKKAVISHLRGLQKSPQRVARYFMHKPIRYAAGFKIMYF